MPAPQIVSLPPDFDFMDGMQIVITAVDASTNATVSGVTISNVSIDVDPVTEFNAPVDDYAPSPLLVPEAA